MLNRQNEDLRFRPANELLEVVCAYNYLGQIVSADPNYQKEVGRRMNSDIQFVSGEAPSTSPLK